MPMFRPTAGLLALSCLLLVLPCAQARERHGSVTGPQSQTATRDFSRAHGDVQSTTTLPDGRTTLRRVDRSAGGAQASMTGPNGGTATRDTVRTDTGSTSTLTGPRGQTATVTVQRP